MREQVERDRLARLSAGAALIELRGGSLHMHDLECDLPQPRSRWAQRRLPARARVPCRWALSFARCAVIGGR